MAKKLLVARAQVMQPGFTHVCLHEAMLRTTASAGWQHIAFSAQAWQGGLLGYAESRLDALYLEENSYIYVDEVSGMIVYFARNTKLTGELTHLATNEKSTVILSKMIYNYDDESSDALVDDAKEVDSQMKFYQTTVPVIILVIATLIILAAVLPRPATTI